MQSSSSSQDLLQREQQIEEVLEQHQNRPPTTSKVRTYVSTSRNTGSAFVDRVNSFGDIRTPEQLNQEEGDDELSFEHPHPMWQVQLNYIRFHCTTAIQLIKKHRNFTKKVHPYVNAAISWNLINMK